MTETKEVKVSDAQRKRMIGYLKSKKVSRYRWRSSLGRYGYVNVNEFSNEQIAAAMNVPLDTVFKPRRKGVRWTEDLLFERISKFVKKHDRWPTLRDTRVSENELPYPETLGRMFFHNQYRGGEGFREAISRYANKNWKKLSADLILTIPNITERREIMNKVGIAKMITKAEKKQQDDFGILWEFPFADGRDSAMLYVEVVNSSPLLDKNGNVVVKNGEPVYDHYFLRVPPATKTAREGVAWTFDVSPASFEGFVAQS